MLSGKAKFTRNPWLRAAAAVVAISLLGATVFLQPRYNTMWARTFVEYLHVPVFGIIAVCLLLVTPSRWNGRKRILVAIGAALVLAALTEIAQIPTARDASCEDLLADMFGAAGFVLIAAIFSTGLAVPKGRGRYLVLLGIVLIAIPTRDLITMTAAYAERNGQLPALAKFDSRYGNAFFRLQNSDIRKVRQNGAGGIVAEIRLKQGPWPGIIFHDLWPDWRSFSELVIEIDVPEKIPMNVNLRVHDRAHMRSHQPYSDRFNRAFVLLPGKNEIRVSIDDIRTAPSSRDMDISSVEGLVIFGTRTGAGRTFVLHEIRLE